MHETRRTLAVLPEGRRHGTPSRPSTSSAPVAERIERRFLNSTRRVAAVLVRSVSAGRDRCRQPADDRRPHLPSVVARKWHARRPRTSHSASCGHATRSPLEPSNSRRATRATSSGPRGSTSCSSRPSARRASSNAATSAAALAGPTPRRIASSSGRAIAKARTVLYSPSSSPARSSAFTPCAPLRSTRAIKLALGQRLSPPGEQTFSRSFVRRHRRHAHGHVSPPPRIVSRGCDGQTRLTRALTYVSGWVSRGTWRRLLPTSRRTGAGRCAAGRAGPARRRRPRPSVAHTGREGRPSRRTAVA